jgi:hypothetical protein
MTLAVASGWEHPNQHRAAAGEWPSDERHVENKVIAIARFLAPHPGGCMIAPRIQPHFFVSERMLPGIDTRPLLAFSCWVRW